MALVVGPGHEEQREAMTVPGVKPETKQPRKKSLRLRDPFYLSFNCLFTLVNLKILFCREAILGS